MYQKARVFFSAYMQNFDLTIKKNYESSYYYKYRHTLDVVEWMKKITNSLNLDEKETNLALTVALFHDLGRFVQLDKYQTYNDLKTNFDHALESVNLLQKYDWFKNNSISKEDQDLITFAILNHNKKEIKPCKGLKKELSYLLRDADKLAVLQRSPFHAQENDQHKLPAISDKIYTDFLKQKLLNYSDIKNNTDQVVVIIAFIFDLNYMVSKKYVFSYQLLNEWLDFIRPAIKKEQLLEIKNTIADFKSKIES